MLHATATTLHRTRFAAAWAVALLVVCGRGPTSADEPSPPPEAKTPDESDTLRGVLLRAREADRLEADALAFEETEEYEKALALVAEVIALDDERLTAYELELRALRKLERIEDAIATAEALLARFPRHHGFRLELARALAQGRRYAEALDAIAVRAPRPAWSETFFLRAVLEARNGSPSRAMEALENAARWGFAELEPLANEESFASLRGLARYEAVVARVDANHRTAEIRKSDPLSRGTLPLEARSSIETKDLVEMLRFAIAHEDRRGIVYDLTGVDGKPFRSADRKERYQVIFLWAHWSAAATAMVPDLVRLAEIYRDRGVDVILLAADLYGKGENFTASSREYLLREGIDLPCGIVGGREAARTFHARAVPQTFFVAPGNISYLYASGPLDYDALTELTDTLLDETAARKAFAPTPGESDAAAPAGEPDDSSDSSDSSSEPGSAADQPEAAPPEIVPPEDGESSSPK